MPDYYYLASGLTRLETGGGGSVEPLRVDGLHFKRLDGSIWKYRAVTAFSALDDFIKGDTGKLETYAAWSTSLGLNCWRVFGVWNNIGLKPQGNFYYRNLGDFFNWLMDRGLYCHFTMLCDQVDGSAVRLPKNQQLAHLEMCIGEARQAGNVITEEFNEFEKNDDDAVCGVLQSSDYGHVLGTRSWWGENQHYNHAGSLLNWTTGHTDRGQEWARTFIQSLDVAERGYGLPDGTAVPATRRPHVLGEPRRIAEGSTPRQHADYVAGGLLFGAGSCLHGGFHTIDPRHESDLQFCRVPEGQARECCEAVGAVYQSNLFPPDCHGYIRGAVNDRNEDVDQGSPILHRDRYFGGSPVMGAYEEPTGAARTYFREHGGKLYGLAVDPGPQWRLEVRAGWRLVAQGGYDGNMLVMERD